MTEKFNSNGGADPPITPTLCEADGAVADALLGRVAQGDRSIDPAREQRLREWLKVLDAASVPVAPADLLERTLDAVQADRMRVTPSSLPSTRAIDPAPTAGAAADREAKEIDMRPHVRRRWSRRVAELGAMAVAASILLAVVFVGLNQARQSNARVACAQNLKLLASGLGAYTAAHGGHLPMLAVPANRNWMMSNESGTARSNISNLLPAVKGGYITEGSLRCAGVTEPRAAPSRPEEVVSDYSYVHMYNAFMARPAAQAVILADRNPLFAAEVVPTTVSADATNRNSGNHRNKGNYLLHMSGEVSWVTNPNVGGDNIWTVNSSAGQRVMTYTGTESPLSNADVFLCP